MESLFRFVAPPSPCGYLPDQLWRLEYEHVAALTAAEYMQRMREGWRRFGHMLFRPRCPACSACRSLRVVVDRFRPDRSQRRARRANEAVVQLRIAEPRVSRAKLLLYDRYHAFQSGQKGWPQHPAKDPDSYIDSFVFNPFPVEEWCYYVGRKLVGVGYVDALPAGLSAIYFYYDPEERGRSPGTWNVLRIIEEAAARGLPHAYLGYYVAGCPSLEYKSRFVPNEVLGPDGQWRAFAE
jgi:arginine-tRNA-protein transferase